MIYAPAPNSQAEKLIGALKKSERALRTPELSQLTGIDITSIGPALRAAVEHGLVTRCKVQNSVGAVAYEYRIGPGIASRAHVPDYKTPKSPIVPVRAPATGKVMARPQPKPIYPKSSAQPAVAPDNTGSNPQEETPSPAAVAVAATEPREATPEPKAKGLGIGPAARPAPAGAETDILGRVQAMKDDEFADFVAFLIRMRSWTRGAQPFKPQTITP